jgi:hypothetical protein
LKLGGDKNQMTLDGGEDFMASEASRKRKRETKKFK